MQEVMRCDRREWTMAGRHARATETASENGSHCWAEQHRALGKRRRGWASEVEAGTTGRRCTRRRGEGVGGSSKQGRMPRSKTKQPDINQLRPDRSRSNTPTSTGSAHCTHTIAGEGGRAGRAGTGLARCPVPGAKGGRAAGTAGNSVVGCGMAGEARQWQHVGNSAGKKDAAGLMRCAPTAALAVV